MHKPKSNKQKRQYKLMKASQKKSSLSVVAKKKAFEEKQKRDAQKALANARKSSRNPKEILKALYNGEKIQLTGGSVLRTYSNIFEEIRRNREDLTAVYKILNQALEHNCEFVDLARERKYVNGLLGVAAFNQYWIRPIENWKPKSHNTSRQFSSLLRHLFAKYPVPNFMDSAFYNGNRTYQNWFIHVGNGKNIKSAAGLPIVLTSKMAHHMMEAPSDYDIPSAIRWGQVHAMGGDERLVTALLGARINFANNEFWSSVIQWLIANPMLDTTQIAPIVDYINHMKFVPSVPNDDPSGPRLVPPQPNLCMKKRTVEATLKGMEDWHRQVGKFKRRTSGESWVPCGIPGFYYEEGEHNKKRYHITELLSVESLKEEGAAMSHCVGSYSHSCSTGKISIWSMVGDGKRMLTIEVDNQTFTIRQARGKFNATPDFKSKDVMNRWAIQAGLNISRWLS